MILNPKAIGSKSFSRTPACRYGSAGRDPERKSRDIKGFITCFAHEKSSPHFDAHQKIKTPLRYLVSLLREVSFFSVYRKSLKLLLGIVVYSIL
jgi:hypothetical protein